jgi:hypothetical protein
MPKAARLGKPQGPPFRLRRRRRRAYLVRMGATETESLYWRDLPAWTEEQVVALRALAARRDLPNTLDLENLIEEMEALGRSQFNAAVSPMRLIFEHLIKLYLLPKSLAARHWRAEIVGWHASVLESYAPSMRQKLDLSREWRSAARRTRERLASQVIAWPELPAECPVPLDDVLAATFDIDAAVARIAHAV